MRARIWSLKRRIEAERQNMPVLVHAGNQYTEHSKLEYARPYLFDEVARSFPKLRIIIAQLGQPWVDETICLLAKHQNVFADVSGLDARRFKESEIRPELNIV